MLSDRKETILVGYDRAISKRLCKLSGGLFVLTMAIGLRYGSLWPVGTIAGVMWIAGGIVLLFLLAVASAHLNKGVLVSWVLVFGPVYGWLLHPFLASGPNAAVLSVWAIAESSLLALLIALTVGTLGYLLGEELRRALLSQRRLNNSEIVADLLIGRDRTMSKRMLVGSATLFLVALVSVTIVNAPVALFPGQWQTQTVFQLGTYAILIGLAGVNSYYNEGLVVGWTLVFAPTLALFGYDVMVRGFTPRGFSSIEGGLAYVITISLLLAVLLGTFGFVVGTGARYTVARPRYATNHDGDKMEPPN